MHQEFFCLRLQGFLRGRRKDIFSRHRLIFPSQSLINWALPRASYCFSRPRFQVSVLFDFVLAGKRASRIEDLQALVSVECRASWCSRHSPFLLFSSSAALLHALTDALVRWIEIFRPPNVDSHRLPLKG
ncbi:hypothetical protein TGP89_290740 [Toxoplasma gondii p89]|uniref:Uncharacterized protein n=1 Tax=Toxoplasma gondii p89 TaxID=943119 RepID=A0A086JG32_TOXGO|nr:hypothetical protein TGP89_290740 [Toxoplasma gondii p89]